MHPVYYGWEVANWRCMCCDMVFSIAVDYAGKCGKVIQMGGGKSELSE